MAERAAEGPRLCGDDLVTLAAADAATAQRLAAALRKDPLWLEVVPGLDSVVVQFDPAVTDPGTACARCREVPGQAVPAPAEDLPPLCIPVRYGGPDGPDLDRVCRELRLTPEALIAAHTGGCHRVALLGFTPGFAYVAGLDDRLAVGRLERPRQQVPAGSVGVAGAWTGLYALAGPGGWPLIGRTTLALFDPRRDPPVRLQPGQRIRFQAIGAGAGP